METVSAQRGDVAAFSQQVARLQDDVVLYVEHKSRPDQRLQRLWDDARSPKIALLAVSRRASLSLLQKLAQASWPREAPRVRDDGSPEVTDWERAYLTALGGLPCGHFPVLDRATLSRLVHDAAPHARVVMQAILHRCIAQDLLRGVRCLEHHRVVEAFEQTRWARGLLQSGVIECFAGLEGWRDWQLDLGWLDTLERWHAQAPHHTAPQNLLRFEGPARRPRMSCARDGFCSALPTTNFESEVFGEMGVSFAVEQNASPQQIVAQNWQRLAKLVQSSLNTPDALAAVDALCNGCALTQANIERLQILLPYLDQGRRADVAAILQAQTKDVAQILLAAARLAVCAAQPTSVETLAPLVNCLQDTTAPILANIRSKALCYPNLAPVAALVEACQTYLAALRDLTHVPNGRALREQLQDTLAALQQGPSLTTVLAYILSHAATFPGTEAQRARVRHDVNFRHTQALQRAALIADDATLEQYFQAVYNAHWLLPDAMKIAHSQGHVVARNAFAAFAASSRCKNPLTKVAVFDFCMTQAYDGALDQAHAIFAQGHADALPKAVQGWGGVGPLPDYLENTVVQRFASNVGDLQKCIGNLAIANEQRQSLWAALVEVALRPLAAVPLTTASDTAPFTCAVCMEQKPAAAHIPLRDCTCTEKTCLDCCPSAVLLTDNRTDQCPTGCGAVLRREDLERLGLPKFVIGQAMRRMTQAAMAKLPGWVCCPTPDCLGGNFPAHTNKQTLACGMCHVISTRSESDPVVITKLLQGVGSSFVQNGEGMIRECYGCGVPTEKGSACAHMTCCSCRQHWHFIAGRYDHRHHYNYFGNGAGTDGQRYRPLRDGILGRIKFYEDIPHGTLTQADIRRLQARAEVWLKTRPYLNDA